MVPTSAPLSSVTGKVAVVSEWRRASTPLGGGSPTPATLRPASVAVPVAVVPAYSIELRSPTAAPGTGSGSLATGSDSPVRLDSSTSHHVVSSSRQSAGTSSPPTTRTRSPTTSRSAGISTKSPPRLTVALIAVARVSSSSECSVRSRWAALMAELIATTPPTSAASRTEPTAADKPAPRASRGVRGFASSARMAEARFDGPGVAAMSDVAARLAAAAWVRPDRELPSAVRVSSIPMACQSGRLVGTGRG